MRNRNNLVPLLKQLSYFTSNTLREPEQQQSLPGICALPAIDRAFYILPLVNLQSQPCRQMILSPLKRPRSWTSNLCLYQSIGRTSPKLDAIEHCCFSLTPDGRAAGGTLYVFEMCACVQAGLCCLCPVWTSFRGMLIGKCN